MGRVLACLFPCYGVPHPSSLTPLSLAPMDDSRELTHARLADLDLDAGRILIEAGAGTGKTYLLASIHLQLILAGHGPRAIGAVTFTNAATEELRGRLRARLRAAARGLEGDAAIRNEPWWPLVEAARRSGDTQTILRRLRAAQAGMDEAPIHTIHGFCLQLLRRHPGAVDMDPALDPEADDRIAQAAQDFWRQQVIGDAKAWQALKSLGIPDPHALAVKLKFSLPLAPLPWPDTPEPPEDLEALQQRLTELQAPLVAAIDEEWNALIEGLKARQETLHKAQYKTEPAWWKVAEEALESWRDEGGAFPAHLGGKKLQKAVKKVHQNEVLPWLKGFRLPVLADEWNTLVDEIDEALNRLGRCLLTRALGELPTTAARLRREAGSLSPDDLLRLTFEALDGEGGDGLAAQIAAEIPYLLVDEFQDTDALQYGILQRLESADVRLILIGDPKQAIYAFRGADVHTYLQAKRDTPPERRFLLTHNHRSRPALCQAVNRLFAHDHPFAWTGLDHPPVVAAKDAGGYPALALPEGLDPDPAAGLTLWPLAPEKEAGKPNKEEATALCAASAARHIAALLAAARDGKARLGERPIEARDIAVLVRGHDQAEAVRAQLARLRIASAYTSRRSVFDTEAASGLLAWLEALAEPEAPARLRTALADPLTGLDLAGLRRALNEDWEDWLERSAELHALWRRHGVLAAILRLLETLEPKTLARREDGERLLTDLLHLAELLQTESVRQPEPAALARWFHGQVEEPPAGEDAVLRLESERDAVHILTIHKAKGLQFPIVYLPFLWSARPVNADNKQTIFTFHHGDRWRIAFGKTPEVVALAERERLSEDLRLLYVALTRAETKLYGWAWPVGDMAGLGPLDWTLDTQGREAVAQGQACFRLDPALGKRKKRDGSWPSELLDAIEAWEKRLRRLNGNGIAVADAPPAVEARPAPPPETTELQPAPLPPRSDDPWRITSYSGILRGEHRRADYDAEDEEAVPAWTGIGREWFPPGAATGNFLHRLLEETDFQHPDWATRRDSIDQLRLRFALPGGEDWWTALTQWMDEVLGAPLPEGGCLADIARGDRLHEADFHFRVRGASERTLNALLQAHDMAPLERWVPGGRLAGLLTGAVDLIYRRQNRYYIVDFKSNLLPDYGPARLHQAMLERRYDLQYLLYATALHRHLKLRLPGYDYEHHFGGVRYLFLRGMSPRHPGQGIFAIRPAPALIEGFDALLEAGGPAGSPLNPGIAPKHRESG